MITNNECDDFSQKIINLTNINGMVKAWRPGPEGESIYW